MKTNRSQCNRMRRVQKDSSVFHIFSFLERTRSEHMKNTMKCAAIDQFNEFKRIVTYSRFTMVVLRETAHQRWISCCISQLTVTFHTGQVVW